MTAYDIYRSNDHACEERWSLIVHADGLTRVRHEWRGPEAGCQEWEVEAFLESGEPSTVKEAFLDLLSSLDRFAEDVRGSH